MIRTVLVALDDTERAPLVFEAAAEICAQFQATLVPFRAIEIPPEFPAAGAGGSRPDPLPAHAVAEAVAAIDAIVQPRVGAHLGLRLTRPLVRANADCARAILAAGDELDADMIVIGSHGYLGLDRLLGTLTARIANRAHRNILVVHARETERAKR